MYCGNPGGVDLLSRCFIRHQSDVASTVRRGKNEVFHISDWDSNICVIDAEHSV